MSGYLNVFGSVSPSQQEWNEWPFEIGGFVDGTPPSHTRCGTSPLGLGGPMQVEETIAKQLVGPILGPGVQSQFGDRVPYSNRTVCLHK